MTGRKRRKQFIAPLVLLALAVLVALSGMLILSRAGTSDKRLAVLEQKLRDMKQLKTVSQTCRSVVYVEEKSFWKGSKNVLFTIEYEITAGVDFADGIDIKRLSGTAVQVSLPPAKIFSSDADEGSIHQIFLREPYFNQISMSDYMPQIAAQGEENLKAALESGILRTAGDNAQTAVLRVLRLGGVDEVVFTGGPDGQ